MSSHFNASLFFVPVFFCSLLSRSDSFPTSSGIFACRILTLSASMGLMNQLDRTPCVGGLSASSSNSSTKSLDFLYPYSSPPTSATGKVFVAEPSTETYLRKSIPLVNLPSSCHDLDVKRLLECGDPWKGGLGALAFRGKIEGR